MRARLSKCLTKPPSERVRTVQAPGGGSVDCTSNDLYLYPTLSVYSHTMSSPLTVRLLVQDGGLNDIPTAVRGALKAMYTDFPWSYSSHETYADSTVEV